MPRDRNHSEGGNSSGSRVNRPAGNLARVINVLSVDDSAGKAGNEILEIPDVAVLPQESKARAGDRARRPYHLTSFVDSICLTKDMGRNRQRIDSFHAVFSRPDERA